jgi:hypothetical protein
MQWNMLIMLNIRTCTIFYFITTVLHAHWKNTHLNDGLLVLHNPSWLELYTSYPRLLHNCSWLELDLVMFHTCPTGPTKWFYLAWMVLYHMGTAQCLLVLCINPHIYVIEIILCFSALTQDATQHTSIKWWWNNSIRHI